MISLAKYFLAIELGVRVASSRCGGSPTELTRTFFTLFSWKLTCHHNLEVYDDDDELVYIKDYYYYSNLLTCNSIEITKIISI